jgi:hypothetical protein
MKLLLTCIFASYAFLYSYANLSLNGTSTQGNWNGSYFTDKYGPRLCSNCHGSGPSNGGKNIVLTSELPTVSSEEEISLTFGIAEGYNPPFDESIMGIYIMINDGGTYKKPSEMGWAITEDPNSNDEKYNYNEKPEGDLIWRWTLKAPTGVTDTEFKAFGYVGKNDYEQGEVVTVISTVDIDENVPTSTKMGNYPNPFNPTTTIFLELPQNLSGELSIYNISGEAVETIKKGDFASGSNYYSFDGSNLNSGVYFLKFTSESFNYSSKLVLTK